MLIIPRYRAGRRVASALAVAALLVGSGAISGAWAATMAKADYDLAKERIGDTYKADKTACDSYSGNTKDVCVEKAKGAESVATAELEYRNSGKPADARKVEVARADANYAVAKDLCDDKAGNAKDVCVAEAKAQHTKAMADSRLAEKVSDARQDATEDRAAADYKVALQKCDALAGDAKTACVNAAKARFNKT